MWKVPGTTTHYDLSTAFALPTLVGMRRNDNIFMKTPMVKAIAQEQFGCSDVEGVELDHG
jgi:hypothetical protein